MAQIRQYDPQIQQVSAVNSPHATGDEFGGGIAQGVGDVGTALEKGSLTLHEYKNKVDTWNAEKIAAAQQGDTINWLEEQKKNAPPGASGFADQITESMKDRTDSIMQREEVQNLTPQAKSMLEERMMHNNNRRLLEAHHFEATSFAEQGNATILAATQTAQNTVYSDPSKREEALQTMQNLINAHPTGDQQTKGKIIRDAQQNINNAAMNGTVDKLLSNPMVTSGQIGQMLKKVQSDDSPWKTGTSDNTYIKNVERLNRGKGEITRQEQSLLVGQAKDSLLQYSTTGDWGAGQAPIDAAWVNKNIIGAKQRSSLISQVEAATGMGETSKELFQGTKSFSDIQSDLNKKYQDLQTFQPGDEKFKDALKAYKAQDAAFKGAMNSYRADPVGFIQKRNPELGSMYQKMKSGSPIDANNYVDSLIAKQKELNPNATPQILSKDDIGAFQASKGQIGDNPEGSLQLLNSTMRQYGPKAWPMIVSQLASKNALTPEEYVAAGMSGDAAKAPQALDMLRASAGKDEDYVKQIGAGGGAKDAIAGGVRSALSDFQKTFAGQPGGDRTFSSYFNAVNKYALYKGAKMGRTPNNQEIAGYAKDIILDEYSTHGTYRVPTAQGGSSGIEDGVEEAKKGLESLNLVLPKTNDPNLQKLPDADKKNLYVNNLKQKGYFINKGDDSGLRYVDFTGAQVFMNEDGKPTPVQYTWGELRALSLKGIPEKEHKAFGMGAF